MDTVINFRFPPPPGAIATPSPALGRLTRIVRGVHTDRLQLEPLSAVKP